MCRSLGGMENLMEYAISIIIGYLLGSISPAALISKIKKINLRKTGTKNLGATNTTLVLGKKFGAIVMIFDIAKGAASVLIAKLIFKEIAMLAGLLAGSAAVVGHMFPFYLRFRGGKGLAAYGGMVLAFDPLAFLLLLVIGLICAFVLNYGIALTASAAVLFPFVTAFRNISSPYVVSLTAIAALTSAVLLARHWGNIYRAFTKKEMTTRQFLKRIFGKNKEKTDS